MPSIVRVPHPLRWVLVIGSCILLGVWIVYYIYARYWIVELYYHRPVPVWLGFMVEILYPRFSTEQARLPLSFFVERADQILWRLTLCHITTMLGVLAYYGRAAFRARVDTFFASPTHPQHLRYLRVAVAVILLAASYDWLWIWGGLEAIRAFYAPLWWLRLLGVSFPPLWALCVLTAFFWLLTLSLAIISQRVVVWVAALLAVLFVVLQSLMYSFHKIDHTFVLLNWGLLLLPFALAGAAWALALARLLIGGSYFLAGLEKLLIGGIAWFHPDNLRIHLYHHASPAGLWLAQFPWLCAVASVVVVCGELVFILGIFYRRWLWAAMLGGWLLHTSIYIFLGIGGWVSWWVAAYVFLPDSRHLGLMNDAQK